MRIGRTQEVIIAEPLVHPVPAEPGAATEAVAVPRERRPSPHPGERAVRAEPDVPVATRR